MIHVDEILRQLTIVEERLKNPIEEDKEQFLEKIKPLQFDPEKVVERPKAIISIDGGTISSPSDLTVFVGQSKAGKSGVLSSVLAGMFRPVGMPDVDTLGLQVEANKDGKLVYHIDTEQSEFNYYKLVKNATTKSGRSKAPDWFVSYYLRQLSKKDRKKLIEYTLEENSKKFNGVYAIIIDGIADYVGSVNNDEECEDVINWFVSLAIKYHCPLITVLHLNPGAMEKGRGHLGSHLERKCESMLTIKKDSDGISTIEEKLLRNAGNIPILRFIYDREKDMHVSYGTKEKPDKEALKADKIEQKKAEMEVLAMEIFYAGKPLSYGEMKSIIHDLTGKAERTAEKVILEMKKLGFIKTENNLHSHVNMEFENNDEIVPF